MGSMTPAPADLSLSKILDLAVRGQVLDAQRGIESFVQRSDYVSDPGLASAKMFVEGIIEAYKGQWSEAQSRLRRSLVVDQMLSESKLCAPICAWQSYVALHLRLFADSVSLATRALECSDVDFLSLARATSNIATVTYVAGADSAAEKWFARARLFAERSHDRHSTSSILYNMAAMRIGQRRVEFARDAGTKAGAPLDLSFIRSAMAYDGMAGQSVFPSLHRLMEGQALALCQRFSEACVPLRAVYEHRHEMPSATGAVGTVDLAFSLCMSGDGVAVAAMQSDVSQAFNLIQDEDDKAIAATQIAFMIRRKCWQGSIRDYKRLALGALTAYGVSQREAVDALQKHLKPIREYSWSHQLR